MTAIKLISWFFFIYGALLIPFGCSRRSLRYIESGLLFMAMFFLFFLSPFY